MHLENGHIIPDSADEAMIIAMAELEGADSRKMNNYPLDIWTAPSSYRRNLIARLENGQRVNEDAVVRGLVRLAMTQRKIRLLALDIVSQLAEKAVEPGKPDQ
ncbi:MAG TPA: hypothetical protein VFW90_02235 [Candidatus Saccharimonadales bacterium]|nr:hypothetical protein [Candidatus Saccharimonadales bacterium]